MALLIKTTGLEQYAPGGEARTKLLIVGGSGAGKTRMASFFPRPIFADCEAGLASVADRKVAYVPVSNSTDMLDLLTFLKGECRLPKDRRTYDTVVVDTLDAYQRKLKQEWMDRERAETFTGWEAWGYINQKMQILLTRLLNLDMNVVVNVHYKDKTTKDDQTKAESHQLMLQLSGESADTTFNDFDQVGWMGTYWEAVGGERVQKRGLTFTPTPDKPFLKDRLHVTPKWFEVLFADSDYEQLFVRVAQRLETLTPGETVGEVPSADLSTDAPAVVTPGTMKSGALPAKPVVELPLLQMDKPTLAAMARELGIETLPDGSPIKGNTLKGELVGAIEHHRAQPQAPAVAEPAAVVPAPAPAVPVPGPGDGAVPTEVTPNGPDMAAAHLLTGARAPRQAATSGLRPVTRTPALTVTPGVKAVPEGLVDTATGELRDPPDMAAAVATVEATLGGQVVPETRPEPVVVAAPVAVMTPPVLCEDCGTDLAGENSDQVKLAWIKFRKKLCEADYAKRRTPVHSS